MPVRCYMAGTHQTFMQPSRQQWHVIPRQAITGALQRCQQPDLALSDTSTRSAGILVVLSNLMVPVP